jgi:hypothetical protein
MNRNGIHQAGYTRGDGPDDDETRDLIQEAGRLARGTSAMIGGAAHVLALVDEVGGMLATVLDAFDEARSDGAAHREISVRAHAIIARLDTISEAEQAWREVIGIFCPRCDKRYHTSTGAPCPACGAWPTPKG